MEENENQEPDDAVQDDVSAAVEAEAEAPAESLGDLNEPMKPSNEGAGGGRSSAFMGVPIEVVISVGKARPLVSDLVNLRRDSVITLDSKIDDPVELFIGDRLIARGELQEMENDEGQLGVRLTEVADLSNGV